jgi:polyisoprenyl-phosphate glycosyltransferase
MSAPIEISVVIPCLNEAENVEAIAAAVKRELAKAGVSAYELIFIDNGSTDGTVDLVKGMCAADPGVRLIVNNRNYGQKRSPTYAIYQTSGAAVIGICADFQDPPEMLGAFIERWRAGAHIVLGVRASEKVSLGMRLFRALGYGFLARFSDYRVIPDATGFGLYDRAVVDCLKKWRDPEPFFRGMLVESGFSLETMPYARPPRAAGRSKNSIFAMIDFGLSGVASASSQLLRAPLYLAPFVFAAVGVALLVGIALLVLGRGTWTPFLLALGGACFGVTLVFLGLMGEQVRLIAKTVRDEPLVVEKERVNFPAAR